jgi:hydroxyacylglutathione hydrolase
MILRPFLYEETACASYLFGCLTHSTLAVVDPHVELVETYLDAAERAGSPIAAVFETHVQADHVSGARRLAALTGAPVLIHQSAPVVFSHVDVADGEQHELGNVRVTVLHTPGHTPDSTSLLVTDRTRAPEPWFVLTGDTLFSGGVGRPDLLGEGVEVAQAEQLYESLHGALLRLPDHIEVFPAHFGGAACGKGLSGKPGSTIGFERRFNPALQRGSKADFVEFVLEGLPPQPEAFAENRRRNLGLE